MAHRFYKKNSLPPIKAYLIKYDRDLRDPKAHNLTVTFLYANKLPSPDYNTDGEHIPTLN